MIAQYVDRDHRNWDERIPELQLAYNTARHEATGYTPAFLNLGREIFTPARVGEATPPPTPPPDDTRRYLEEAHDLVRIHLARAFQKQQKYYNLRRRPWQPEIGEWVWKREHPLSNKAAAFNAKLAPKFRGPLEVCNKISPVIFDLRDRRGRWTRHVHVQDLKPAPRETDGRGDTDNEATDPGEETEDEQPNNNNGDDSGGEA
ncbi:uncharacterized protein LOC120358758 [Solenopsis invicta]|uniref:uncharacterized protein LOC120358758 n=1 Tax=Solenopsis invicta TaxID=13686 RepID=UPI00193DA924|nr:uncharacterized protein LOC120358758 [Solenopsis invicta]